MAGDELASAQNNRPGARKLAPARSSPYFGPLAEQQGRQGWE